VNRERRENGEKQNGNLGFAFRAEFASLWWSSRIRRALKTGCQSSTLELGLWLQW